MFKHRVGQMLPQAELVFIAVLERSVPPVRIANAPHAKRSSSSHSERPLNRDEKTSPSLRPLRARAKRARGNN